MSDSCYSPRMLSLITSYRCNAACAHCCFECAPSDTSSMSLPMLEKIFAQCEGFRKISFSGGEPFLDWDTLVRSTAMARASARFESIAAVTNCFWAESDEKSLLILHAMKEAGLSLLGISCDQYHERWIPARYVAHAVQAARELEIPVQINVISPHGEFASEELPPVIGELAELIGERSFRISSDLGYARVWSGEGIDLLQGGVMPVGRAESLPAGDIGFHDLTISWKDACILQRRGASAPYEGQVLTLLPDYRCFPCCSLYAPSGHLEIGNAQEESLGAIISRANASALIRGISQIGILGVKEIIESHFEHYCGKKFASVCEFCYTMCKDPEIAGLFDR